MGEVSRRDFIKQVAIGSAAAVGARAFTGLGFKKEVKAAELSNNTIPDIPVVAPAKGHIVVNSDYCAGCLTCNVVCSVYKEGVSSTTLSRIKVLKDPLGGYICEPVPCKQCDGPECLYACPVGAIRVDEVTGARYIEAKACIGCKKCMEACPATPTRIIYNEEKKICEKCDLCNGDPQCVKFCPLGAITYQKTEYA